ncbi:YggS family pyridoxal phosphate-dependent enzyme [Solimicrobium silvestre]|uniref:YggS family pyridoxal phosphate-dependent enzyme n=1 Tax=Solimicrobium silvestre TaxID=2099400 RepID=UPI003C6EECF5
MLSETNSDRQDQAHYPQANNIEDFRHNLACVNERITRACRRVDRNPSNVRLLPVSKTFDEASLRLAYTADCRLFGENKVQEASRKWESMTDLTDLNWALIGHLQTNKVKQVARFASEFHALDSLHIAEELDRRLQVEGRYLDVYVQVNTSGEASKYGLPPNEVISFLNSLPSYNSLRVRGLMTLAIFSSDEVRVRSCFAQLRELRDQARQDVHTCIELEELSMGMSSDAEIAIEEGATIVRIGQAIFGARSLPNAYYWPRS